MVTNVYASMVSQVQYVIAKSIFAQFQILLATIMAFAKDLRMVPYSARVLWDSADHFAKLM